LENLHAIHSSSFQERFKVDIWARIVHDYLTGLHVVANHLGRIQYPDFPEGTLPILLGDVPLNVRKGMWFLHDGALSLPTFHAKWVNG
jgi:hypothetical protein